MLQGVKARGGRLRRCTARISRREIAENHRRMEERNRYHRRFGYDVRGGIAFVLSKCLPLRGRVLEIGTGQGRFAMALAARVRHLESIDADPAVLRVAALNLAWRGVAGRVRLCRGDAEHLPWPRSSFDAVVSMNAMHHMRAPIRVVDEMLRVVKPGGRIVIADFSPAGFRIMGRIHASEGRVHPGGRCRMDSLRRRLAASGRRARLFRGASQDVLVAD